MPTLHSHKFAIDTRPFCVWDWDLPDRNLAFLEGIDPNYFAYLAAVHSKGLESDERQYSALALRLAYSHALETLFALIAATVQAPHCVAGWMTKYLNSDLKSIVGKINHGQPVYSRLPISPVTWNQLSKLLIPLSDDDDDDLSWHELFAESWKSFASDFLNRDLNEEHNCGKHGLRLRGGGFRLAIRPENAPEEEVKSLGGSEFGSAYYQPEKLGDSRHFRLRKMNRNWNPHQYVGRLQLISMSMINVLSFLMAANGADVSNRNAVRPKSKSFFREPWEKTVGAISFNMDMNLDERDISSFSAHEIIASYDNQRGENDDVDDSP